MRKVVSLEMYAHLCITDVCPKVKWILNDKYCQLVLGCHLVRFVTSLCESVYKLDLIAQIDYTRLQTFLWNHSSHCFAFNGFTTFQTLISEHNLMFRGKKTWFSNKFFSFLIEWITKRMSFKWLFPTVPTVWRKLLAKLLSDFSLFERLIVFHEPKSKV